MTPAQSESETRAYMIMWNVVALCRSSALCPVVTAEVAYVAECLWTSVLQEPGGLYGTFWPQEWEL